MCPLDRRPKVDVTDIFLIKVRAAKIQHHADGEENVNTKLGSERGIKMVDASERSVLEIITLRYAP